MKRYNPKLIEPKWQKSWSDNSLSQAIDFAERPKYVMLTEFPYPSGGGMHIGHMREYTIGDIIARQKRMQGYNVLYPMGFDAFGLPTENFAIKNKISPQRATETNVANFKSQLASMGFSFDWQRSFKTSDPDYYRWTQWLFLRFFKANMAYQSEIAVNWCSFCKTGLANEEVINGRHERCDTPVEKKMLKQWMLRITDYAERLIDGLSEVDYPSRIADQQVNWIGRSKGAIVDFKLVDYDDTIQVFTTRPDTLYGATFLVLAPEHSLVPEITSAEQKSHVNNYLKEAQAKSDIERQAADKEKTGIFSGAYAINPANQAQVPIWIADYVLMGYGTGAIMAVPAHDERDYQFASRYQLPIKYVVEPLSGQSQGDEVEKEAIVAVVFSPRENKYLVLDWGPRQARHGGQLFIGGGIEEGEDAVSAAKREIAEETGYLDVKLVRQLPYQVHAYYYSNVKQQNYYAKMQGLLFELVSDKQQLPQLDEGEKSKFTINWLSSDDARRVVDDQGHKQIFQALTGSAVVTGEGLMVASGEYNNLPSSIAREKMVSDLANQGLAEEKINYRLRDWIFSRQHYWGEPIPIIHCPEHGAVAVPEEQLPVLLPDVDHYEPSDDGRSPLAAIESWVNTVCPVCAQPAKRETDTMPNWAGSSWYYLRYFDPQNNQQFVDSKLLDYWQQVDLYLGGMEHVTLHLLYSRFWHQFLFDQGLVPTREPYAVRRGQGIIQAADGSKMSKSKGNIVNPTDIIDSGYGADSLRLAIMFLAPYDQTTPWSPETLGGTFRFLQRIWTLIQEFVASDRGTNSSEELKRAVNRMVKRVSSDLVDMSFNTPIAAMMDCVNLLYKLKAKDNFKAVEWPWALETLIKMLAPFAPHITEELWQQLGANESIHLQKWPTYDEQYVKELRLTIAVQINGKIRGQLTVEADTSEAKILQLVLNDPRYGSYLLDKTIKRSIYVPAKLLSLVTG